MEEQSSDSSFIKRHRMSAMWNGVVIGMGFAWVLLLLPYGNPIGFVPLGLGIFMEVMKRKRLNRAQ